MELKVGGCSVVFRDGGIEVMRQGEQLYFNRRPVWMSVKTYGAMNEFRDQPYDHVKLQDHAGAEGLAENAQGCQALTAGGRNQTLRLGTFDVDLTVLDLVIYSGKYHSLGKLLGSIGVFL